MTNPITTPAQMREAAARECDRLGSEFAAEGAAIAKKMMGIASDRIRALPVAEPAPVAVPLSDADREWIDARADELFRANERERGGVRIQTIIPQDFRDYFVATATQERILSQNVPAAQVRAEALREAMEALEALMEVTEPPERNCSCHINPPCGWCDEYEMVAIEHKHARATLAKLRAHLEKP